MAAKKRQLEDTASVPKAKKTKVASEGKKEKKEAKPEHIPQPTAHIVPEETDFPRGGGTSFTPLEVKTIRAEAVKEANAELFTVRDLLVFCASRLHGMHRTHKNNLKSGNVSRKPSRRHPPLLQKAIKFVLNISTTRLAKSFMFTNNAK